MRWPRFLSWFVMVLMGAAIGIYALGYFYIPEIGDPEFKSRFDSIPWSARMHIIPGGLALIIGSFQFHPGIRNRWTSIHRYLGGAYVAFVLLGAIGGLVLAWYAPQSHATRLGFGSLAVVWFYSGCMAFIAIRAGDVALHRQWMIRSYALTLAAVSLRIQLPIYQGAMNLSFNEGYAIVAWFSWIPNLIIAEWFINQTPIRRSSAASS